MVTRTTQSATWNRDDRDLLVELRTNMQNLRDDVASSRSEVKDMNIGLSARLLNLETNTVSKIEVSGFDQRIRSVEDANNQWLGKQQLIAGAIGIAAGLIGSIIQSGKFPF